MESDVILPKPIIGGPSTPVNPPADQNAYGMINPEVPLMENQNTNFAQTGDILAPTPDIPNLQPEASAPLPSAPDPQGQSFFDKVKDYISAHRFKTVMWALLTLFLIGNLAVSIWLFKKVDNYSALSAVGLKQTSANGSTFNGDDTLYINTKNKTVGVGPGASNPDGLQVNSSVTDKAQGSPNVRLGLLNGEPTVLLQGKDASQWEFGVSNATLQIGQLGTTAISLDKTGNATLGSSGSSTVTIQAGSLAVPNGLNIGNNALFVDNAHGSVAIGANNASGFKLLVAGNFKANGSVQSGGQIIGVGGSAASPAITFSGTTNTGIYSPGANTTSVSAGGTETLRVSPGNISVLNGASLDVSGFISSGGSSPAWQIIRLTGALNGSGNATMAHGISNASSKVIMAMAWYQSGGQAKPLAIDYVDGTNIQVDGGSPGAAWRGMIMYTSDSAGW